jgi:hypothetical protein
MTKVAGEIVSSKINQIQLVLFNPGMAISDKIRLANNINNTLGGLFDGDPVVLPLPPDAPPELPRILLSSKDGKKKLQASIDTHGFTAVVLFQNLSSACPVSSLPCISTQEIALIPPFTGGEFPLN